MPKYKPKDAIALVIVLGYVLYVLQSGNSMIPGTIMLIVGYYFARRDEPDHSAT